MIYIPSWSEIAAVAQSRGEDSDAPHQWKGLLGAWPFQEGGGATAFDVSGFGNHGTLTNMDPATDWVTGDKGSALDFDGVDDEVIGPGDGSSVDLGGTSKITVSAWANVRSFQASSPNIREVVSFENPFVLRLGDSGTQDKFQWVTTTSGEAKVFTAAAISLNTWYYIAGTYDGSTMRIYINGQLSNSVSQTGTLSTTGFQKLNIGARSGSTRFFDGQLAGIHVYNRVFSATEVAAVYRDPWAAYRLRPRRVFKAAAASGAIVPLDGRMLAGGFFSHSGGLA